MHDWTVRSQHSNAENDMLFIPVTEIEFIASLFIQNLDFSDADINDDWLPQSKRHLTLCLHYLLAILLLLLIAELGSRYRMIDSTIGLQVLFELGLFSTAIGLVGFDTFALWSKVLCLRLHNLQGPGFHWWAKWLPLKQLMQIFNLATCAFLSSVDILLNFSQ